MRAILVLLALLGCGSSERPEPAEYTYSGKGQSSWFVTKSVNEDGSVVYSDENGDVLVTIDSGGTITAAAEPFHLDVAIFTGKQLLCYHDDCVPAQEAFDLYKERSE